MKKQSKQQSGPISKQHPQQPIQYSILVMLSMIWIAQLSYAPALLSAVYAVMILSLFLHYKKSIKHTNKPYSKSLKISFVVLALVMIYLNYRSFLGVDAGTAVLSLFLYAKALETRIEHNSKRDLIILFNFALFVTASLFLLNQSIWMASIVLLCMVSCFIGLYRVQTIQFVEHTQAIPSFKSDAGHIFKFIGLALPFFLLLFLFFPRIPALWQVPIASKQGVTGISDRMSPGDIAELSQSSKLAFRILGDMEKLPDRNNLYWRAMALDQYDGKTWNSSFLNLQTQSVYPHLGLGHDTGFKYQYLAADQNQKWITGLERSVPLDRHFLLHTDNAITASRMSKRNAPISLLWLGQNSAVDALSQQHQVKPQSSSHELNAIQQKLVLNYPLDKDPKAQQFAHQLFAESHADPKTYIGNLIEWYKRSNFAYTLKPGLLGENRVDEFLFQSKQGFCEHYASSFVLLMRYVGIPARVVVGYQGGQFSPDQQSWEVRQMDAHAWTEVFLDGQWQRIDPTAVIAPQRIDLGMQDYLSNDQSVLGEMDKTSWQYQQFNLLKNIRVWSDYVGFQWQNKVVGYNAETQKGWLRKLGFNSNYAYGFIIIFGIVGLGLLYWFISRVYVHHQVSPTQRRIIQFSKRLTEDQKQQTGESFQHWMERLALQVSHPLCFEQAINIFQKIVYLNQNDSKLFKKFENLLKECSTELKKNEKNLS